MPATRPVVGPYRAEQLVAIGATGEVWRAQGQPAGASAPRRYALKVARGEHGPELLAAEGSVLEQHAHPHLVHVERKGRGYLITEWVDGTPLDRWGAHRPLSELSGVLLELVGALAHLHAAGQVHGDLKPAHALVDGWGHLKLLDVGSPLSGPLATGRGTPGFTAPEVLLGAAPGRQADLYGLGATLYATLTGRVPFDTSDPAALAHLPTTSAPVPVGAWRVDVPDRLQRLVSALLLRDPSQRPSLDIVQRVLSRTWLDRVSRPVLGMTRARARLHAAVTAAADGRPTVVVVHGPVGSGRRTLLRDAIRQARLEGMDIHDGLDIPQFESDVAAGRRPVAFAHAAPKDVRRLGRDLLAGTRGGLLLLHAPRPSSALHRAGAVHVTPDTLSREDAHRLGAWLGVSDPSKLDDAWTRTQGHPRSLWIALQPVATQHTDDDAPFALPALSRRVLDALDSHSGVLPLDRLARVTGLRLTQLADATAPLEAGGRISVDPSGWIVRLAEWDEP